MSQEQERVITYILERKNQAEDASRHRRDVWKELWELYQNKQDLSKKKRWQSRCFVPKLFMAVEQSSSMVKRAVMSTSKLFKLSPKDKDDGEAKENKNRIEAKLKQALDDSNFAECYGEMIKGAFLLGVGVPKPLWDRGLKFTNVDIVNLHIDPAYEPYDSKPSYIIESTEIDLAELRTMAKRINKDSGRQIYKMKEIKSIEEDFSKLETQAEEQRRRGLGDYSKVSKKVCLLMYWGDVIDKDDKKIKRDQLIVLANDRHIIRQQDNPFIHNKPPYIITIPIVYPHRGIAGISLVEPIVGMQYATNSIVNMGIDNMNFSVNKMFEVQSTNLLNPRKMTDVYPGKMIFKHTQNQAVREIETTNIGNDVFNMLGYLSEEIQKGTAVTEFISGWEGKRKTATEAQLKTAQAQGIFDVIARDIESNSLAPLIEMCFDLMVQFGEIEPQFLGRYNFKVGGVSLLLAQRELRMNISEVLGGAVKVPELGQMTDIKVLYQKYLETLNLQDVFVEDAKGQQPTTEHITQIQQRAAEDAKNKVAQMSPEEIERA